MFPNHKKINQIANLIFLISAFVLFLEKLPLKSSVNQKLYLIKKLFYLSLNIKIQFFKTLIHPHFDYCSSLAVYFNKTLVNRIERFYNIRLFRLSGIFFLNHSLNQQFLILKPFNLLPYKIRLFFKFNTFCYNIF